jgi:DHA1 family multidrug/chloramphenicol efflux transport protein-like MFS transporter
MPQPLINITQRQAHCFAAFLLLYEFLTYIANDMIMPGMLLVVKTFHGNESAVSNSLTAYLLGGASLQLMLGPLSDRIGRRSVMMGGVILFFICTIGIACSQSMTQFMFGRFFQGMGLCFLAVVGYASLQEIFSEMDAIRLLALMGSVALIAPLIGPLAGAVCILHFNWRWIFVVISVFALFALWGIYAYMPETVGATKRDGECIHPTDLSFKMILANYKCLLKNRAYICATLAVGFQALPCIVWVALSPVILVAQAQLSYLEYGLWQLPIFGACILGSMCLRKMSHHTSVPDLVKQGRWIVLLGLTLMFVLPLCRGNAYIWLMPGLMMYFFGMGYGFSPLNRLALFSTPMMKGMASALISLISMSMQGVGLLFANVLYFSHRNVYLALFCLGSGIFYVFFNKLFFRLRDQHVDSRG